LNLASRSKNTNDSKKGNFPGKGDWKRIFEKKARANTSPVFRNETGKSFKKNSSERGREEDKNGSLNSP